MMHKHAGLLGLFLPTPAAAHGKGDSADLTLVSSLDTYNGV